MIGRLARRIHEDLEHADDLLVHHQGAADQGELRRIARAGHALDGHLGRDDLRLGHLEEPAEQGIVWCRAGRTVHQAGLTELDLGLDANLTRIIEHPEGTARSSHGRDRPLTSVPHEDPRYAQGLRYYTPRLPDERGACNGGE